jgi:hypothetical protein
MRPVLRDAATANAPRGWPARRGQRILFVVDNDEVLLYDPDSSNPSPEGSITDGVNDPWQVAVDKHGTLYISNLGTITEYPPGQSSPSLTISSGLSDNTGVAVDSKDDVFASNLYAGTVVAYKPGATTPYETISGFVDPVALAVNRAGDVYVASVSSNAIDIIPAGTTKVQSSGLSDLVGPNGIAFGRRDTLYVANFGTIQTSSFVAIYKKGSTSPARTITSGIENLGPGLNGVTDNDMFFQSNQDDDVVGYKRGQSTPFSAIAVADPWGIASSPEVRK